MPSTTGPFPQHRTFPGHPALDAGGRAMLRRILGAYARRNPAVGYCQVGGSVAGAGIGWVRRAQVGAAAGRASVCARRCATGCHAGCPVPPPQGLNFLAATLMLWMAEEDAFWCLSAVIEDILGCSYFDERMVLPQVRLSSCRRGGVASSYC